MAGVARKLSKLFSRGIVPVFKDAGVTKDDLRKWIKLSLAFEDKRIRTSSLYLEFCPHYFDSYQTGLNIVGFGLSSQLVRTYGRYFEHEYIVTATLGKQTDDSYGGSPLLQQHEYRHISPDMVRSALSQFVGEQIEQATVPALVCDRVPRESENNIENHFVDRQLQNSDECQQISRLDDDSSDVDADEEADSENEELGAINNNTSQRVWRPLIRIKDCYSIELLQMHDSAIQLRVISDGLYSCRALVRDLGLALGCHATIDSLHLRRVAHLSADQALLKHELHLKQIQQAVDTHTASFHTYIAGIKEKYPEAAKKSRYF